MPKIRFIQPEQTRSIIIQGDEVVDKRTNFVVLTPVDEKELRFFVNRCRTLEKTHNRALTPNEVVRLARLIESHRKA